jgi:nucleotide-binding universal stress UspA family protein
MYRVIVVGTDGSETAAVAVHHATGLAKLTGATLHIVHAYPRILPASTDDPEGVIASIAAAGEFVCERAAAEALSEGVRVETHARRADAADLLIDVAEKLGADLLVVGNRGMSGVRRFVLGSVPNKVSHHCPCSLLIVSTTPA